MGGDGWKYMDLRLPPICLICGKRVKHAEAWEYRYNLGDQEGEVRHIDCIRKTKTPEALAAQAPRV